MNRIIKIDAPYPDLVITKKNPVIAKKLMGDFGGKDSETTSILSYTYQSYVLNSTFPEIASTLEGIAICEMKHHELLGTLIHKLGGFPVVGGRNQFWNGSFINYTTDLTRILHFDIMAEEQAVISYERTIASIDDDAINSLLLRIIEDEELHIRTLKSIQSSFA